MKGCIVWPHCRGYTAFASLVHSRHATAANLPALLLPCVPTSHAAYASSLKQARRLGGLSGFVHGSSNGKDPTAQGTLRLYEAIIGAMQPAERADVAQFGQAERQRVAQEVGCSLAQVEDCMARYLWMRAMTSRLAQLKREGKPMPTSVGELESMLGTWQQYKADRPGQGGDRSGFAALNATGPGGVPCPLAGLQVGKNTKCTLTRKAYKACCGRGQRS